MISRLPETEDVIRAEEWKPNTSKPGRWLLGFAPLTPTYRAMLKKCMTSSAITIS